MPPFKHFPPNKQEPKTEIKTEDEPKARPLFPCMTCAGFGRDRNNVRCKKCKGTGSMSFGRDE